MVFDTLKNRTIFLFKFFAEKLDAGEEVVTSSELSSVTGLTRSAVGRLFTDCYSIIGKKNYGYNVRYAYREFAKLVNLTEPRKISVVGPRFPFLKNEHLEKRNIQLTDCPVIEQAFPDDICGIILTRELKEEERNYIQDSMSLNFIINLSGENVEIDTIPVYGFDILELICAATINEVPNTDISKTEA